MTPTLHDALKRAEHDALHAPGLRERRAAMHVVACILSLEQALASQRAAHAVERIEHVRLAARDAAHLATLQPAEIAQ